MENQTNEGYTLQKSVSFAGSTYVLGHNPTETQPYVTWMQGPAGGYAHGNYFTSLEAARQDLLRRSIDHLPSDSRSQLIQTLLTEEIRSAVIEQGREDAFLADIEFCLSEALTHLGIDQSILAILMDSEEFKRDALHVYHKQDHSYENEALTESLEGLIQDKYPDLIPNKFTDILKIPPEELEIQNDALTLTLAELDQKYGAVDPGSGLLFFCKQIESPRITLDMEISIYPKADPSTENAIHINLYGPNNLLPWKRIHMGEEILTGVTNIEQLFSCNDFTGITWQLDLHADERLRRTGQQYIFQTDSSEPEYEQHNGQTCTVERMLNKKEADILCDNMMWKVRFEDGIILDAFDNELTLTKELRRDLEQNPAQQKPIPQTPLTEKIASAKAQHNEQTTQSPSRTIPDLIRE